MWRVDPTVESTLWNVHGLAHKVDFELEFSASERQSASDRPAALRSAERLDVESRSSAASSPTPTASGRLPRRASPPCRPQVDERLYALAHGMGDWVTAPSMEIAGDLEALRLGVHQRWQTKRGPPDDLHIVDWIEFNTDVTLYPDPDRDNFGQFAGLLDYNFRWHVGDRLTVLSDGIFDFFDLGQKEVTMGAFLDRPAARQRLHGRALPGRPHQQPHAHHGLQLPDEPQVDLVLRHQLSTWPNPGTMASCSASRGWANRCWSAAASTYDPARNSVGAAFTVEPRFLPKGRWAWSAAPTLNPPALME